MHVDGPRLSHLRKHGRLERPVPDRVQRVKAVPRATVIPVTALETGATADIGLTRIRGSRAHLQTVTAARLTEPVPPDRPHRAPCEARLQAGYPGNRLSKGLPATTNQKPWASLHAVTVTQSSSTSACRWSEWPPIVQPSPRSGLQLNGYVPLCLSANGLIRAFARLLSNSAVQRKY